MRSDKKDRMEKKSSHTVVVVRLVSASGESRGSEPSDICTRCPNSPLLAWCSHRTLPLPDTSPQAPAPEIQTPRKMNIPPQSIYVHDPTNKCVPPWSTRTLLNSLRKQKKNATVGWIDHHAHPGGFVPLLPFKIGRASVNIEFRRNPGRPGKKNTTRREENYQYLPPSLARRELSIAPSLSRARKAKARQSPALPKGGAASHVTKYRTPTFQLHEKKYRPHTKAL